mmetsp:Transcript_44491/g.79773  ORF Transcript_44491/g.79773 Transcript_44491/m.79773 type:complete len:204 (-) Transcript_44491:375-986(-)
MQLWHTLALKNALTTLKNITRQINSFAVCPFQAHVSSQHRSTKLNGLNVLTFARQTCSMHATTTATATTPSHSFSIFEHPNPLSWAVPFVFTEMAAHHLTITHTEMYVNMHIQSCTQHNNPMNTHTTIQSSIVTQTDIHLHSIEIIAWAYNCTHNPISSILYKCQLNHTHNYIYGNVKEHALYTAKDRGVKKRGQGAFYHTNM